MGNYIKIDRKILDWEWYKNLNTCRLFFHILLKANWKDGRFEGKEIPRGSFVTSVKKLSLETALTVDEVRTSLNHLVKTGEITKQTTNKYTVITVSNYELYQEKPKQSANNSQPITKLLPNDTQTITKLFPTIEEKKEGKNKNTQCSAGAEELFDRLWEMYPVKRGKGQVPDAQKEVLYAVGYDELCRALRRYREYVDGSGYMHYQNGSTFFNGGYADYLDCNYSPDAAGNSSTECKGGGTDGGTRQADRADQGGTGGYDRYADFLERALTAASDEERNRIIDSY